MRAALLDALRGFRDDASARIAVLAGAGKVFCAGADVREFSAPPSSPALPEVAVLLDELTKPTAALLHGAALGGGLELALCCHHRAALPGTTLGLPEVKLGVIPGCGGTQRLPRLIGLEAALELIPAGKTVAAERALELGVVDRLLPTDSSDSSAGLEDAAFAFAAALLAEDAAVRRVSAMPAPVGDAESLARCRARLAKRDAGANAPFRAVDAIENAATLSFAEGLRRERAMFLACLQTAERAGLVHNFFAEKRALKAAATAADGAAEIKSAAVVGGGRMGAGIAWCLAAAGIRVKLLEANPTALAAGLARARDCATAAVRRGRLSEAEAARRAALIAGAESYDELGEVDLALEAVTEDLDLKLEVFRRLDGVCRPGTILATNTSSLDLEALAEAAARPEFFAGAHFFNPAPAMKLLEVARARATSPATLAMLLRLGRRLGKIPVTVGACPGLAGNRMAFAYGREAELLAEEGAAPEQVDGALRKFGMAMGPLETRDLAGVDNGWNIRRLWWRDLPPEYPRPRTLDGLYRAGRLGRKSGAGYYRYESPDGPPRSDPAALRIIEQAAAARGAARRRVDDDEIVARCLCALVNEGAKILGEGMAAGAGDLDMIMTRGFGFPARRGGPMFWADAAGLPDILAQVRAFQRTLGAWWTPAPLLARLGENGGTFAAHA